jgi:hypothetical protein
MAGEGSARAAALGLPTDRLGDAAIEAFDETIGLWPIGSGQTVIDLMAGANEIERMLAGRPTGRLVLHVNREAVGELGAIVGQDGMNGMREVGQEPLEEAGRSFGIAPAMDLDIDVAGGAVDRDKGIAFAALESRQMLQIDVDEADGRLLENTYFGFVRLLALADVVALKAAMNGAAGQLVINATPHHLDDVVQRQLQGRSQFADQRLFHRRQAGRQVKRPMRAVRDTRSSAPATNCLLANPEFRHQLSHRLPAALDVSARLRGCGGIRVQVQFHDPRRSLTKATPRSTPIPSSQSPGTKHERRDPYAAAEIAETRWSTALPRQQRFGVMGPCFRRDDSGVCVFVLATRFLSELFISLSLSEERAQGKPGADCARSTACKNETTHTDLTGTAETARLSPRNV